MIKWLPGKAGWQPRKNGDPGKTDDLQEILARVCKVSNLTHSTHKREPTIATKLNNEQCPQSLPREGEDSMVTATTRTQTTRRLTQTTLTGHVLEVKCHCGMICKNAKGLKIHQSRTTCGTREKHMQCMVETLSETQEESTVLDATLAGQAGRKIDSMTAIVYKMVKERFGTEKKKGSNSAPAKRNNRRKTEIMRLRREIKALNL